MSYPLENAIYQWEEGYRRLEELGDRPAVQARVMRAVEAVRDELRRRIGPTFTAAELADLYGRGTDWCLQVAASVAPEEAAGWDPQVIADAAFHLYLPSATDYAGGRPIPQD